MLKLRQPKPRVQLKQPLLLQKLKLHPKLQRKLLRLLKAKLWMQSAKAEKAADAAKAETEEIKKITEDSLKKIASHVNE